MTFLASLLLVIVLVIRPQEIWPSLEALHILDVLTGLVVLGLLVEVAYGKQKQLYSPQLPFLAAFVVTGYFVTAAALGLGRAIPPRKQLCRDPGGLHAGGHVWLAHSTDD